MSGRDSLSFVDKATGQIPQYYSPILTTANSVMRFKLAISRPLISSRVQKVSDNAPLFSLSEMGSAPKAQRAPAEKELLTT
jgi:hypothetical protein